MPLFTAASSPYLTSHAFVVLRKLHVQLISGAQSSPAPWLEKKRGGLDIAAANTSITFN
jgi:hypothetical protein